MIAKIFEFGGIYTCPIVPEIPTTVQSKLSPAELADMKRRRELVMATATREILHTRISRLMTDTIVDEHTYLRVHCSPKRFPIFNFVDWPQRVVAHGSDYVILDKPAFLPVAPTVDNILESSLAGAAKGIGVKEPLLITSRLDQATEGLIVLGKTAEFVQKFGKIIRREGTSNTIQGENGQDSEEKEEESVVSSYKKMYKALVSVPPPLGTMTHHVKIKCRLQGTPFFSLILPEESIKNEPKAQYCELIVHAIEKVNLNSTAKERFDLDHDVDFGYEVSIELVTGRTHQIRAQLSAAGCPLLGDDLYTPLASSELRKRLEESDPTLVIVDPTGRRLLTEADGPIGLQAFRLEIDDRNGVFGEEGKKVVFEAGTPWWRI
jgi:23S rRNA-/tRNA-specific pseudouridylate synthase